jgi:rhodanese-related sulfurtransferase
MVGAVGRTDLLGDDRRDELARQLFQALHTRILTLPDDVRVYPTHGAGSFCAAPSGSSRTTTIGRERATNPLLQLDDEDAFVTALARESGTFPRYFRELPEVNRRGPALYDALPQLARVDLDSVQSHLDAGAALIDARPITAFAEAHPPGAISIEHRGVFGSWLGWLIAPDQPVVFLLDGDADRADLVRQCLTIGHDRIIGEVDGGLDAWRRAELPIRSVSFADPNDRMATVIDVRQRNEWEAGHVPGAVHVELGALAEADVPSAPLMVMCGHGERAMTGASLLVRRGHEDVSVLLGGPDDWQRATGTPLATGP